MNHLIVVGGLLPPLGIDEEARGRNINKPSVMQTTQSRSFVICAEFFRRADNCSGGAKCQQRASDFPKYVEPSEKLPANAVRSCEREALSLSDL